MITIEFTPVDFRHIRLGYSPLIELVMSYRLLAHPTKHGRYRPWIQEVMGSLEQLDLPYLGALVNDCPYIVDFLIPSPADPALEIQDEIAHLQTHSVETLRKNLQTAIDLNGESEILRQFMAYPHELLQCLIDDLFLYWQRTLAPHWSRIAAALDGDVIYRARQLALKGTEILLVGLHPKVQFADYDFQYELPPDTACDQNAVYSLKGKGLYLIPTMFGGALTWQIEDIGPPLLIYPSRGTGLWWEHPRDETEDALEIALGAGRAQVLRLLITPASTGEIAYLLHMTSGAASQHLKRLQRAGLVEPQRSGKRIYYHLSQRGVALLKLFI